jgi:hypothetical protein
MGIINSYLDDDVYAPLGPFVFGKNAEVISQKGNWSLAFEDEQEGHRFGRSLVLALANENDKGGHRWRISRFEDPVPFAGEKPKQFVAIELQGGCEFVLPLSHALDLAEDYLDTFLDDSPFGDTERDRLWSLFDQVNAEVQSDQLPTVASQ